MTKAYAFSYNSKIKGNIIMQPKPLKFQKLDGISDRQIKEHHDVLYTGYVNKYNEIVEKLPSVDLKAANGTYSDLRELTLEKGFAFNGVILHEYYFDNMGGQGGEPDGAIAKLINRDFGSFAVWNEQFKALGLTARGWVVLAYNFDLQRLENYICDVHNQGGIWNTATLVVMDVYEHAYFLGYATKRADYIEKFMANIDWSEVNTRIKNNIPGYQDTEPKEEGE